MVLILSFCESECGTFNWSPLKVEEYLQQSQDGANGAEVCKQPSVHEKVYKWGDAKGEAGVQSHAICFREINNRRGPHSYKLRKMEGEGGPRLMIQIPISLPDGESGKGVEVAMAVVGNGHIVKPTTN